MKLKQSVRAGLQQRKTTFLQMGVFVMLLFGGVAVVPVKAQDTKTIKLDTAIKIFDAKEQEENPIFVTVEEMPEFVGGEEARIKFLMENFKYPRTSIDVNWQGKIFIGFVVEADGSLSNVKILRGVATSVDEEAIRVVKLMPKWKAGKHQGKAVRVQYHMVINIDLQ